MEDKKVKTLEITAGANNLVGKTIVSCHELNLDEKSKAFVCKVIEGVKICERDFLQADKMGLYRNLIKTAKALGKKGIDLETVIKYFGSRLHEESALKEVAEAHEELPMPLLMFLLVHLFIPVRIIGKNEEGLIGEYENDGKKVRLEGILLFKEDSSRDFRGKVVLFHYAPVVVAEPEPALVKYLLDEQKKCQRFMEALDKFNGKTIEINKFSRSIKRTMKHLEL